MDNLRDYDRGIMFSVLPCPTGMGGWYGKAYRVKTNMEIHSTKVFYHKPDAMRAILDYVDSLDIPPSNGFITTIEDLGAKIFILVTHANHVEDPCAGQSLVVAELCKKLREMGISLIGKEKITHSGGCASLLISKKEVKGGK